MSYASEQGHWYDLEGEPCYTQIVASGKNKGNDRPTTLRDARKLNLLPSVTTVLGILDKPALTMWKVDQGIMAALTCPRLDDETESEWMYKVKHQDAKQTTIDAAEEGTRIHGVLENHFKGGITDGENFPIVAEVLNEMEKIGIPADGWLSEKSCVSKQYGFAGKVDLHSKKWILDFKTKDGDLSKVKCYEDQFRQLSAYREALGYHDAQCVNVFISRDIKDETGHPIVKVIIHTSEQSEKGLREFLAINECWKVIKNYNAITTGE